MRVGVIRGDLPGPVYLEDLEVVSQFNPPTEPLGQDRRINRPTTAGVGAALAVIPAGVQGTTDISAGATITNGNHTLRAKTTSAGSFVVVTVANAVYASGALLVAAVNAALVTAGVAATAALDSTGVFLVLKSNTVGSTSFIAVDTTGAGSTFNGVVGFPGGGTSFTAPTTAAVIAATLPVSGPLNVSTATLVTNVGAGASPAQLTALADSIAPKFVETDVAIKSFQVGNMHGYLSSSFTPDANRLPPIATGAAISVVADDGSTPFTAALTVVTGAVHNSPSAGDITITGTNLGVVEDDLTVVKVTSGTTNTYVRLYQKVIRTTLTGGTQGSVAPTSIVIPASLLAGLGIVGSKVQVQYTSLASGVFTVT